MPQFRGKIRYMSRIHRQDYFLGINSKPCQLILPILDKGSLDDQNYLKDR
jgi:hypothetical protein